MAHLTTFLLVVTAILTVFAVLCALHCLGEKIEDAYELRQRRIPRAPSERCQRNGTEAPGRV